MLHYSEAYLSVFLAVLYAHHKLPGCIPGRTTKQKHTWIWFSMSAGACCCLCYESQDMPNPAVGLQNVLGACGVLKLGGWCKHVFKISSLTLNMICCDTRPTAGFVMYADKLWLGAQCGWVTSEAYMMTCVHSDPSRWTYERQHRKKDGAEMTNNAVATARMCKPSMITSAGWLPVAALARDTIEEWKCANNHQQRRVGLGFVTG